MQGRRYIAVQTHLPVHNAFAATAAVPPAAPAQTQAPTPALAPTPTPTPAQYQQQLSKKPKSFSQTTKRLFEGHI